MPLVVENGSDNTRRSAELLAALPPLAISILGDTRGHLSSRIQWLGMLLASSCFECQGDLRLVGQARGLMELSRSRIFRLQKLKLNSTLNDDSSCDSVFPVVFRCQQELTCISWIHVIAAVIFDTC